MQGGVESFNPFPKAPQAQAGNQGRYGGIGKGTKGGFNDNCFAGDTLVATCDGPKRIDEIAVGSSVWAFDFKTKTWVLSQVEVVHEAEYLGKTVTVKIRGAAMTATAGHPFWIVDGEDLALRPMPDWLAELEEGLGGELSGRWVSSEDMRPGDVVYLRDGTTAEVEELEIVRRSLRVYNLTVADLCVYAVSWAGVLVHNTPHSFENNENIRKGPRQSRGDRVPTIKPDSDRLHGDIPSSVPKRYSADDVRDALAEVRRSLANRRAEREQLRPKPEDFLRGTVRPQGRNERGYTRGHDQRIVDEENWQRQLEQRLRELEG